MDFLLSGHEINLKGGNRGFFATRLRANLNVLLAGTGSFVRPLGQGFYVNCPDANTDEVRQRLQRALGVQRIVAGVRVANEFDAIAEAALTTIAEQSGPSFALDVRRQDKGLPFSSYQLAVYVGRYIQQRLGLAVNLHAPDRSCKIICTRRGALVTRASEPGPGGMPAGTAGKLVALVSAGFDSPVAAYRMIRRGARLAFLHFYGAGAQPGESSRLTVDEIVRQLTRFQLFSSVYFCHFEPIQAQIVLRAPSEYRVLLYRRMMLRIAERLAGKIYAHGVVTGDSLAQVASQTVRNLEAVSAAARTPVYRPLIGNDKVEIMAEARRIGTFDYSSENPYDCCSAFLPPSPALSATPEALAAAESGFDVEHLAFEAIASLEHRRYRLSGNEVVPVASRRKVSVG